MPQPTISWAGSRIKLIDQTLLPLKLKHVFCADLKTLWQAIKTLKVRGAPALGMAGAYGILLAATRFRGQDRRSFCRHIQKASDYLASSRPTAVNLCYAMGQMQAVIRDHPQAGVKELKTLLRLRADELYEEDRRVCRRMGKNGARLIRNGASALTVCNAGALATVDYGTALGVMYSAKEVGKSFSVYACETRPLLQGARLTTWELLREKIPTTLICDNMAATLMRQKKIHIVFTGADRIAANGDTANKIGTYSLAVLARHHNIPFYVVAPLSTFDLALSNGKGIPIEERDPEEVKMFAGVSTAPRDVAVYNPAFDVTESALIKGIITEAGIIRPPYPQNIRRAFKK